MDQLFINGRMIDVAMAVLALEVMLVWANGSQLRRLLPTLLSGLMLLLAWRFTQAGMAWLWIAAPLSAAGAAHGWDVWRRWPAARPR